VTNLFQSSNARRACGLLEWLSCLIFIAIGLLWIKSYQYYVETPGVFQIAVADSRSYFLVCHQGEIDLATQWITPPLQDQLHGRVFSSGYGAFTETMPNSPHAGGSNFPTYSVKQQNIGYGFLGVGKDQMFMGRNGLPHLVVGHFAKVTIPFWAVAALFGLFTVLFMLARLIRWRRRSRGVCAVCGYDLRASPDRCPECGTDVLVAREA
jgi:hypothetical protein